MEFVVNRKTLLKQIQKSYSIVKASKDPGVVCFDFSGNTAYMYITDSFGKCRIRHIANADIKSRGGIKIVVNAASVIDILKEMQSEKVEFIKKDESVVGIRGESADETKEEPSIESVVQMFNLEDVFSEKTKDKIMITAAAFCKAIDKVSYAAMTKKERERQRHYNESFLGILFHLNNQSLVTVANNAHRMAIYTTPVDFNNELKFVIHKDYMEKIAGMIKQSKSKGNIVISVLDQHSSAIITDTDNQVDFVVPLITDKYPDYQLPIPKEPLPYELTLKTSVFREVIDNVPPKINTIGPSSVTIDLDIKSSKVGVCLSQYEEGRRNDKMKILFPKPKIRYKGKPMRIAFNPIYIRDVIDAIESEDVTIEFSEANKVTVFRDNADKNYLYLLMPITQ